jgi:hypothetical protein
MLRKLEVGARDQNRERLNVVSPGESRSGDIVTSFGVLVYAWVHYGFNSRDLAAATSRQG